MHNNAATWLNAQALENRFHHGATEDREESELRFRSAVLLPFSLPLCSPCLRGEKGLPLHLLISLDQYFIC